MIENISTQEDFVGIWRSGSSNTWDCLRTNVNRNKVKINWKAITRYATDSATTDKATPSAL